MAEEDLADGGDAAGAEESSSRITNRCSRSPGSWTSAQSIGAQGGVGQPVTLQYTYQGSMRSLTVGQTNGMLETCMNQQNGAFETAIQEYNTCVGAARCN
jgi:hypothetical protein